MTVRDWPDPVNDFGPEAQKYDIAITIDSMRLGYVVRTVNDRPVVSMAVDWVPGVKGVLDGRPVDVSVLPDSIFMSALALQADVEVDHRKVATFSVHVDTMLLAPYPDIHHVEMTRVSWSELFESADSLEAREIYNKGFQFTNPRIAAVEFISYGNPAAADDPVTVTRRPPRRESTVIIDPIPDIFIDLTWLFRDDEPDIDVNLPDRPRGEAIGRRPAGSGESREPGRAEGEGRQGADRGDHTEKGKDRKRSSGGRSASSGERDTDSDDDDDDDDEKLLPAAAAAAATIGMFAYIGGSVGYSGAKDTPIGLSAGYVRPGGGVLVQASVNSAILGEKGPEKLSGRLIFFMPLFRSPLQPSLGTGLQVTCVEDDCSYDPGFSVGAVGNFGLVVLQGGYDLALGGWQAGLSLNFRARRH